MVPVAAISAPDFNELSKVDMLCCPTGRFLYSRLLEGVIVGAEGGEELMSTRRGVPPRAMSRSTSSPRSAILAFRSFADFTYTGRHMSYIAGGGTHEAMGRCYGHVCPNVWPTSDLPWGVLQGLLWFG